MNWGWLAVVGLGLAVVGAVGASPAPPQAQTLAERLGYGKDDKLLIIHADDIGMCHSVNVASTKAMLEGVVTCGSVMVPCPWFPEIAAWARERPEADLGLHLTLTSEWKLYRWRPVASIDKVPGLLDPEGFLWHAVRQVKDHASPLEVETELRAQIERALQFGMKPTHLDSHMGTLFSDPRYFEVYVRLGKEYGILPMLLEPTPEVMAQARTLGLDYAAVVEKLKGQGYLFLNQLNTGADGNTYEERKKQYHDIIRNLKPGVTEIIVHLSGDEEEIRNITGSWQARYNEFRIFTDADTKALIEKEGVKLMGYKQLAALWKRVKG